jgi:LPXTG-site transpeptidase (sortase) family protein
MRYNSAMPALSPSEAAMPPVNAYPRLRKFNLGLSVVTAVLGIFLAISPFIPQITFFIDSTRNKPSVPYGGLLSDALNQRTNNPDDRTAPTPLTNVPDTNQLVIPSMFLNETILEGNSIATADKGPWRRPLSGNPIVGGNTVIVGHRWTYRAARDIFFHLDKVKVGDPIAIYWDKKEYLYEVTEVKIVQPHENWVEEQTNQPLLTLYTCTPVWSSRQRLVVRAALKTDSYTTQETGETP